MTPLKTDMYKVILLKKTYGASKRLSFRCQPAHPKTKKQNTNPYKKDQASYPQKKEKEKTDGAPFGVFVFIKTQTQTMYSQSKVKLTLTSVPLMNTLNTHACDTEIEKEEKKKNSAIQR